jgi:hypothetical protein
MKRFVLLVLFVVACAKKKEAPPPAVASGSPAVAVTVDAAPAAEPAAKAELLPAKLGEKDGIVFSDKQGEKVTATVKGQSVLIPDGTKVEVVGEEEPMAGSGEDTSVTVKYEGKEVKLPADRVLREGLLKRSPDGKHAVFTVITSCGDLCHAVMYLVSADGRRTKLAESGQDLNVAWTADKVAVGNGGLWIATLADHAVKHLEDYTSPAYSPEGVLYVRNYEGVAFKVEGDKPTQVWKPKKKRKHPQSDEEPDEDPAPVKFEGGKPKFDL